MLDRAKGHHSRTMLSKLFMTMLPATYPYPGHYDNVYASPDMMMDVSVLFFLFKRARPQQQLPQEGIATAFISSAACCNLSIHATNCSWFRGYGVR